MMPAITLLRACCPAASSPAFSAMTLPITSVISWCREKHGNNKKKKAFTSSQAEGNDLLRLLPILTLKLLMGILCLVAWLLARGLRMAPWLPLAFSSSPSFFSTVAPWADRAAFPAMSPLAMPANLGNSFWVSGYSWNKLRSKREAWAKNNKTPENLFFSEILGFLTHWSFRLSYVFRVYSDLHIKFKLWWYFPVFLLLFRNKSLHRTLVCDAQENLSFLFKEQTVWWSVE